jgi:hypothetical protein
MFRRATTVAFAALLFSARALHAQSLEPRAYAHTPIGLNFAIVGYAYTDGDVVLDASVPVEGGNVSSNGLVLAYARSFGLWGESGKFDATLPYGWASGTATYLGEPIQRDVDGLGDPSFRFTWNFVGAPALTLSEFRTHHPAWLVGASLRVELPLGQYDADKALNLGTNRWSFKPELGIAKPWRRWTFEVAGGVTFYTVNDDYLNGSTLEREPLGALQGHVIYTFGGNIWAGFDGTFYSGGQTALNGTAVDDRQSNSRAGLTVVASLSPHQSLKFYGSTGATVRVGGDFNTAGVVWQYRWGGK